MGGGDREFDDAETLVRANDIAVASNSYDRWVESRDLSDRLRSVPVLTRDADGNETTADVPLIAESATSVPESFGASDDSAAIDEDELDNE